MNKLKLYLAYFIVAVACIVFFLVLASVMSVPVIFCMCAFMLAVASLVWAVNYILEFRPYKTRMEEIIDREHANEKEVRTPRG